MRHSASAPGFFAALPDAERRGFQEPSPTADEEELDMGQLLAAQAGADGGAPLNPLEPRARMYLSDAAIGAAGFQPFAARPTAAFAATALAGPADAPPSLPLPRPADAPALLAAPAWPRDGRSAHQPRRWSHHVMWDNPTSASCTEDF